MMQANLRFSRRMHDEIHNVTKDPSSISAATYIIILLLSAWGGVVRIIRETAFSEKSIPQLIGLFFAEMITSSFVGVITFYLCESAGVQPLYTAAMTAIAGYMGGRSLAVFEAIYKAIRER